MNRTRFPLHELLAAMTFATLLVIGTASAASAVNYNDVAVNAGTLANYLSNASTDGLPGICYQQGAKVAGPSYACFEHALEVSGLTRLVTSGAPVTVFAPTDQAFANLESAVGPEAFARFMANPTALATLVENSIVKGTQTVSDLSYEASDASYGTDVTTIDGSSLAIAFGADPATTDTTTVAVGSSSAVAGQSYVDGATQMFGNGDVLIPLGQITLTSLGS